MNDGDTTNSDYLTYTFFVQRLGECTFCNNEHLIYFGRYDEWIPPERILGRGTRQTRKRASNSAQGLDVSPKSKFPPKSVCKSSPKAVAKKGAKGPPVVTKPAAKSSAPLNGTKGSTRRQNVLPTDSSLSLVGKPAAVKPSSSRRTRSDRNSTELSNGLLEGEKHLNGARFPW